MKIETKFNLKEEVWVLEDGSVKKGIISAIQPLITIIDELYTVYGVKINNNPATHFGEKNVFKTKEELISSL